MPMLAQAQPDRVLLRRFAATREPEARDELVRRYLPLARHAASRYARTPLPFEDLVQVAALGLVKALDRYDPERATAFSTFALPTMTGELRRHFRDRSWAVRPPRGLQEHALAVDAAAEAHVARHGRMPTIGELAARTDLTPEEVLDAREALAARQAVSFSAPAVAGDEDTTVGERLGRLDSELDRAEVRAVLAAVAGVLTPREREIVALRFEEDLTQAEIGRRVGLSQMQVSRVVRVAVGKLRDALADARGSG